MYTHITLYGRQISNARVIYAKTIKRKVFFYSLSRRLMNIHITCCWFHGSGLFTQVCVCMCFCLLWYFFSLSMYSMKALKMKPGMNLMDVLKWNWFYLFLLYHWSCQYLFFLLHWTKRVFLSFEEKKNRAPTSIVCRIWLLSACYTVHPAQFML